MKKIITIFLSVTLFGGILFTQEKGGLFGRKSKDDITLFKSLGLSVEDIATAFFIYKK